MGLRRQSIQFLLCFACTLVIAPAVCRAAEEQQRVVYVVPDLETYMYAISLWDKEIRFPVFIGEGAFLDLFLQGYPGAQIKKLDKKEVGQIGRTLVYRALYAAWGPETLDDAPQSVSEDDLKDRLKGLGIVPRGVVVTNVGDAEFAGGLALAAGHYQPIIFYTSELKRSPEDNVGANSARQEVKEHLRRAVLEGVQEWGYPHEGLGEGIDYITLALNMRHTFCHPRPGTTVYETGYTMTDAIGRLTQSGLIEDGPKKGEPAVYAYCGLLIEAAPQMALYQAMASLFAETRRALYFDTYGDDIHGVEGVKGYQVLRTCVDTINRDQRGEPRSTMEQWHRLVDGGHPFGFVHMTAKGDGYSWSAGRVKDIPASGAPCAVYFVQSGSAVNPSLITTIAGRWLLSGAYVYYGAATEPFLASFNTAQTVARTLAAGGTYGEAFQRKDTLPEQFRGPWKLVYVGDPMARPRFVEDPEEPEWSRTWRRAMAQLRKAQYRDAVLALEQVFPDVPSGRLDEFWDDLLRAYELTLGIGLLNLKDPAATFTPELIDGWVLPADVAKWWPEPGWVARLHLRLTKTEDLTDLLATRLKVEGLADGLKERLQREIQELDVAATHARMWLVLGPATWSDPSKMPEGFPTDMMPNNDRTFTGPDGEVRWAPRLVNPDTYCLILAPPKASGAVLYLAATLVEVSGSQPTEASLRVSGTAAKASPAPQIWINREAVAVPAESAATAVTLKPGINEIVVRIAVQGSVGGPEAVQEPITFALRLTGPDGKRSRTFKYPDLIRHLRSRSDRSDDRRVPPREQG